MKQSGRRDSYAEFKENWHTLSLYERFQQVVALVLTWLIAGIILVAMWELALA